MDAARKRKSNHQTEQSVLSEPFRPKYPPEALLALTADVEAIGPFTLKRSDSGFFVLCHAGNGQSRDRWNCGTLIVYLDPCFK